MQLVVEHCYLNKGINFMGAEMLIFPLVMYQFSVVIADSIRNITAVVIL